MERAASNYRDGRAAGFETVARHETRDSAYLVEVVHADARSSTPTDDFVATLPSEH